LAVDGASPEARRRFDAAATVLLDRRAGPIDLHRAAHELYAVLAVLAGVREDSRERAEIRPIRLQSGVALAPRDAARSVLDFMRTARMLQGVEAAVAAARVRFGSPVEVLYAGCGPFAPLALPVAARLGPEAARFTLMDVHDRSVEMARATTEALGLGGCVRAFLHADATVWTSPGPAPHLIVAEALERALEREPQVAIMANLAPQLAPGGFVVPERISVEACLADARREVLPIDDPRPARLRLPLGTVFVLTAESARTLGAQGVPEVVLPVGAIAADGPTDLMLRTIVTAFGDTALEEYESGITYPAFVSHMGKVRAGTRLRFRYDAGPDPRFGCSLEALEAV
jgi:hypothetical protein